MQSQTQPAPAVGVTDPPAKPRPAPAAAPGRRPVHGLTLLLPPLLTAGLLWLSYFPADQGWLGWVALVPLLTLVRSPARPSRVYLCAWLGGLAFFGAALQWLRVADWRMMCFAWPGLALYCSFYFPLGIFLIRFLDRRTPLPLPVMLPVVWTALEYLRSTFGGGFSWYLLGYSQHACLPILQAADLAGVYGVSLLVAAVNGVLFELLYALPTFRRWCAGPDAPPRWRGLVLTAQVAGVVAALLAAVGYGEWRLGEAAPTPGPRLALIQGNVPQQIRNDNKMIGVMGEHFFKLCNWAEEQKPDLIVWPETSFPGAWREAADVPPESLTPEWRDYLDDSRKLAKDVSKQWPTNVLLGMDAAVLQADGRARVYNSAVLIDADGRRAGRYDKIHCVPFGEYVPLRDVFPFMEKLAPYDNGDYSVYAGENTTHFEMKAADGRAFSFGVVICYEDTDPERARPYAGGDGRPPVDFLLNTSNDGWFDGTCEHDQHLAICRFRAVECRRSVARAVNMGISAVIDGNGRVLSPEPGQGPPWEAVKQADPKLAELFPDEHGPVVWEIAPSRAHRDGLLPAAEWAKYKKVAGALVAEIPIDHRESLYARWGDWLPWACWLAVGACVAAGFFRRRPRPAPGAA
jgi:apolipoprotein N-acyltransferase